MTLEQVKLAGTAAAVGAVVAAKQAGRDTDGTVDRIWINGANFASMKETGLLKGQFAANLTNRRYVDVMGKTVTADFTAPTQRYGRPRAMSQLVRTADTAPVDAPLKSAMAPLDRARVTRPIRGPAAAGFPRHDHPRAVAYRADAGHGQAVIGPR